MRSQEFQIQEGDCGDYWGVAGGSFDVHATKNSNNEWRFDRQGKLMTFNEASEIGRRCWKDSDKEKPGEWNKIDLYVMGDSSIHSVNDSLVMMLFHSRQLNNGKSIPLTKGKIQLQSEGCEVFYRNIKLEPIIKMPNFYRAF